MIAENWKEAVLIRTCAELAGVREDEIVIVLADVSIDRIRRSKFVVVVPDGDDEVRLPTMDQRGHLRFGRRSAPEVADDSPGPQAARTRISRTSSSTERGAERIGPF